MLKFILTIGIIYIVWNGYKFRNRIVGAYKEVQEEKLREAQGKARAARSREVVAQDLVPCTKCGAYVAVGSVCSCERA